MAYYGPKMGYNNSLSLSLWDVASFVPTEQAGATHGTTRHAHFLKNGFGPLHNYQLRGFC